MWSLGFTEQDRKEGDQTQQLGGRWPLEVWADPRGQGGRVLTFPSRCSPASRHAAELADEKLKVTGHRAQSPRTQTEERRSGGKGGREGESGEQPAHLVFDPKSLPETPGP